MLKWIGAVLIIASCGWAGFYVALRQKQEERSLRELTRALDYMQCELQYHLTPLPDLCRKASQEVTGSVRGVLNGLTEELERQLVPDAPSCMRAALGNRQLSQRLERGFEMLGSTLGQFDLEGQLKGLDGVRSYCRNQLDQLEDHRDQRLRSYETLGLCAGAALAILLV